MKENEIFVTQIQVKELSRSPDARAGLLTVKMKKNARVQARLSSLS